MWEAGGGQTNRPAAPHAPAAAKSTPRPPAPGLTVPTATLADQAAMLAASVASRTYPLRAVLTNTEGAVWGELDKLVESTLGLRLRGPNKGLPRVSTTSIAPCAQLHEPAEDRSGWYNGMILLLFAPDVPDEVLTNLDSLTKKLLEVRSPSTKQRCVHHVLAVPCAHATEAAFLAAASQAPLAGAASKLRKRWCTVGYPGAQAVGEHAHLHRLLSPLMRAVASDSRGGTADSAPVDVE